jgi:hypothetical protein
LKNNDGNIALSHAVENGHVPCARLLVAQGSDADETILTDFVEKYKGKKSVEDENHLRRLLKQFALDIVMFAQLRTIYRTRKDGAEVRGNISYTFLQHTLG